MKRTLLLIFILTLILSCNSKEGISSRILERYYAKEQKETSDYLLHIRGTDSLIKYQYLHSEDDQKSMFFEYRPGLNQIKFASLEFGLYENDTYQNVSLEKSGFDLYVCKDELLDGPGPILFNSDYGILLHNNGWGTDFLFLPNRNTKLESEIINAVWDR